MTILQKCVNYSLCCIDAWDAWNNLFTLALRTSNLYVLYNFVNRYWAKSSRNSKLKTAIGTETAKQTEQHQYGFWCVIYMWTNPISLPCPETGLIPDSPGFYDDLFKRVFVFTIPEANNCSWLIDACSFNVVLPNGGEAIQRILAAVKWWCDFNLSYVHVHS